MKYKKEHIKSNGRKLIGGGPRDLQRRQQQQDLNIIDQTGVIEELKKEIGRLSRELRNRPVVGGFSGEQMDEEIRSAVIESIKDLKKEMNQHNKKEKNISEKLKEKDKELNEVKEKYRKEVEKLLKEQSEKLEKLTTSIINNKQSNVSKEDYESDRPQMETVFIDPLESDAGKDLEPFLDVKDVSINEKENMFDKVNKLKGMLGKLPTKK